jgi:alkylhydroperoxidase/carboxymuconolactone decarboxylase family protein YurZ
VVPREEVLEALLQVIPHVGFPTGLTALGLFQDQARK